MAIVSFVPVACRQIEYRRAVGNRQRVVINVDMGIDRATPYKIVDTHHFRVISSRYGDGHIVFGMFAVLNIGQFAVFGMVNKIVMRRHAVVLILTFGHAGLRNVVT